MLVVPLRQQLFCLLRALDATTVKRSLSEVKKAAFLERSDLVSFLHPICTCRVDLSYAITILHSTVEWARTMTAANAQKINVLPIDATKYLWTNADSFGDLAFTGLRKHVLESRHYRPDGKYPPPLLLWCTLHSGLQYDGVRFSRSAQVCPTIRRNMLVTPWTRPPRTSTVSRTQSLCHDSHSAPWITAILITAMLNALAP